MTTPTKKFPISELVLDPRLQARAEQHPDVVDEYAEAYRLKADMPAIEVFIVDARPHVVDGWHRVAGQVKAGETWAKTRIVGTGTIDDAIHAALTANRTNGIRRTNADKRRAVRMALESARLADASSRVIADHVGVSHDFTSRVRIEWEAERRPLLPEPTATQSTEDVSSDDTSPKRRDSRGRMQPATKPTRTPKERVVLDEPTDVSSDDTSGEDVSDEQVSSDDTSHAKLPSYGLALERVAASIARVRLDVRREGVPNAIAQRIERGLRDVEGLARFAVPEVCPRCNGATCSHCRNQGWLERADAEQVRKGAA